MDIQKLPLFLIHKKGFIPTAYTLFITKILCLEPKTMPMTQTLNFIHYNGCMPTTYNYDCLSNDELHLAHNV